MPDLTEQEIAKAVEKCEIRNLYRLIDQLTVRVTVETSMNRRADWAMRELVELLNCYVGLERALRDAQGYVEDAEAWRAMQKHNAGVDQP